MYKKKGDKTPFFNIEYLKLIHWSDFGKSVFDNYYEWLEIKVDELIKNGEYYTKQFRKLKKIEQVEFDKLIGDICGIIETSH